PVGACVGLNGSRLQINVRELRGENIDVLNYTANPQLFITRALSPANVNRVELNEETRKAEVFLNPDQVSLAIGKGGANIKLASMLTGFTIDVFRELDEEEDDVQLDEFTDEIEPWGIEELKKIGLTTARQVLNAPRELIIKEADLEEETVDETLRILAAEFEENE
ncbi:MAG: KH domain-containing protein, partial [Bacteroidaceae bacterium]|nr:KH domain-containing protein [Bacteroidaceae bacterium]